MKITTMSAAYGRPRNPTEELIEQKHKEYVRKANLYLVMYYTTRLLVGLSAGLLPFTLSAPREWPTALSILIVILTVVDTVFAPKDKLALFSKATDLIALANIKSRGDYDKYKEALDVLLQTENADLQQLQSLESMVANIEKIHSKQAPAG